MKKNKKSSAKYMASLNFGIFPGYCLFTCGFTVPEILSYLDKSSLSKEDNTWKDAVSTVADRILKDNPPYQVDKIVSKDTSGKLKVYYILYIRDKFDFSDLSMCCLAHECLHLCQFYLPDILDRNQEHECEAYLHTHLMTQALSVLRGKAEKI